MTRRTATGTGDVATTARPAKWAVEVAAVETLIADLVGQVAEQCAGAGLHRRVAAGRSRPRTLSVQEVASSVPGGQDHCGPVGAYRRRGGKPGAVPGRRGRPDGDHDAGNAEPTEQPAADPYAGTGKAHGGLRDRVASGNVLRARSRKRRRLRERRCRWAVSVTGEVCRSCDC